MTPDAAIDRREIHLLQDAFHSFDQAATSLGESYRALTARLERLDLELAASHEALRVSLLEKEEMRAHLAGVLESLTTGVLVADDQDLIIRCNGAAVTMIGISRSNLLGRPLADVLKEAHLDGGGYPLTAATGIPLSLARTVLRNEAGQTIGSMVLLHDISEVRRLEERLQRRERLAAMGEMIGRIAHEIRNPLGSVELFASVLRKDLAGDAERRRYAEHISMAVQGMDRLLANLLAYMSPGRPRIGCHATEPLVRDALALAAHAITGAGIDVRLCLGADAPAIRCDATQIRQVLLNLILNAVQAMPSGGTLTIATSHDRGGGRQPPMIRIAVSDTGSGIDPSHRSRIFDPFFTTRQGGTGLGLAIVHAIVEAHGGRVEVESVRGCGSTFTAVLPTHGTGHQPGADGGAANGRRLRKERR